jgi:hypothetical protein
MSEMFCCITLLISIRSSLSLSTFCFDLVSSYCRFNLATVVSPAAASITTLSFSSGGPHHQLYAHTKGEEGEGPCDRGHAADMLVGEGLMDIIEVLQNTHMFIS